MYLIRYKETDFDLLSVKELFYTQDRNLAADIADDLDKQLQRIIVECQANHIVGCVEIPELDVFILSTNSNVKIEMVEVPRLKLVPPLSFTHLLSNS